MATPYRGDEAVLDDHITRLRAGMCAIVGLALVVVAVAHWKAALVVMGGYWLGRGLTAMVRGAHRPRRMAPAGIVAVLSLVTGLLFLQAASTGIGLGMALAIFVGLQAAVTASVDVLGSIGDPSFPDTAFGVFALAMGAGLWAIPSMGFETVILMVGLAGCVTAVSAVTMRPPNQGPRRADPAPRELIT